MNIINLQKCAERQHKATTAIVQCLVGLPASQIETFPFVAKKGSTISFYAPSRGIIVDTDFINPYVMNGSFTLELKMKYLNALETGLEMEQGHRLSAIFGGLTKESRDAIKADFNKIVHRSPLHKGIAKIINAECKIQFRWDIEFLLDKANLAFERWRYIYEERNDLAWFSGYSEILSAINCRIQILESQRASTSSGAA